MDMIGTIIWCVIVLGCGALFWGIGVYAQRREEPMWFWSGSVVKAETLTDVKAYNRENAAMWKWYSLWYWAAGIAWIWSKMAAGLLMMLGCTVGIWILVRTFLKIEKKYKRTGL